MLPDIGAVVIGRNEGERLKQCLHSVASQVPVVYVDSGSTDGSVAFARSLGVEVVELDMSKAFTAARARNAGLERLQALHPQLAFVQFIDGDCELFTGWLETAVAALRDKPRAAVVSGRLRERYPEASIYNKLCDLEWDTPVGEVMGCGGIALMRIEALNAVHGFDATLIAGEEPELCFRMREQGWTIWRIEADMAWHDAAMTRFRQWWKRSVRGGYSFAQGIWMHGKSQERYCHREVISTAFWGLAYPLGVALLSWFSVYALLGYLAYPIQAARIARTRGWIFGGFCMAAKIPQALGGIQFFHRLWRRKPHTLIEYK